MAGPTVWNSFPDSVKSGDSLLTFRHNLKTTFSNWLHIILKINLTLSNPISIWLIIHSNCNFEHEFVINPIVLARHSAQFPEGFAQLKYIVLYCAFSAATSPSHAELPPRPVNQRQLRVDQAYL